MQEAHSPGVMEENLNHLVLLLKRLDIADMGQCKFLDRPGRAIMHAEEEKGSETEASLLVVLSPRGSHAGPGGLGLFGSAG